MALSEPKHMRESTSWCVQGSCPDFNLFDIFVSDFLENTENYGIMIVNVIQKISAHQIFHVSQPPLKVGWGHVTNSGQWAMSQAPPPSFPSPAAETLGYLCSRWPCLKIEGGSQTHTGPCVNEK